MSRDRIRIYGSNGELRYDSEQRDAAGTDNDVRAQFDSGLLWYHNPDDGILRCQTKARTSMPEQFVVEFKSGRGVRSNPVEAFRAALDDAFAALDWEYIPSNRETDIQVVIEKMGEVEPQKPPAYTEGLLKRLIDHGTGLTFAVPSKIESVAVAEYFRDLSPDISIAISQSGRTDAIPDADVVVVPSDDYPEIRGIDGTDAKLQEAETDAYVDAVTDTVERAVDDPVNPGTAPPIATILNRSGLRKRGITAVPNRRNKRQSRRAFVWPFLGATALLFVGLFVLLAEPAEFATGVTGALQEEIPVDLFAVQFSLPLWSLLVMMGGTYGVSALLLWLMGILKLPKTGSRVGGSNNDTKKLPQEALVRADEIRENHNPEYIDWKQATSRLHRQYPQVLVKPKSTYERRLYVSSGLGLAVGVLLGAVAGGGTALAYDWLSQRPMLVLNAAWLGGFAVPVGFLLTLNLRVFKRLVGGRSRKRGSKLGGRSRSRGPAKFLVLLLLLLVGAFLVLLSGLYLILT